ncbi:MAG TPA: glycosyltransferase family 1 protein [Candidatus Saccharimonadales bacterium]|nr:glycosyltransferase family 1 protein [Candidatus Saccharimonadales bacterium]
MRIAIDARIINSGTGRYIERLLHYLEEIDHTNEYLILVRQADLGYYKPSQPNFKIIEAEYGNYSFGEQFGLARLLYKLKPDLVHFCMPQQPLLYIRPAVTSVLDLNLLRITANDDMNPVELRIKKAIFGAMLWIVSHRTKHVISISNYTKEDVMRFSGIKADKITVAYPAADKAKGAPQPLPEFEGKPFIMYVGRAEPYKNNRGLILAHQQLLQRDPDLRLVIVGRKDVLREADIKWVSDHNYKNVAFLGFVTDEQLAWLYGNARAYVFPSFMEGFGLPGLEAMLYGAPVAASHASCIPEILGDAAVYFDAHNQDEMVRVVGGLIHDDKQRAELIERGKLQAQKYSWRRMAEQILDVYNHNAPKKP